MSATIYSKKARTAYVYGVGDKLTVSPDERLNCTWSVDLYHGDRLEELVVGLTETEAVGVLEDLVKLLPRHPSVMLDALVDLHTAERQPC